MKKNKSRIFANNFNDVLKKLAITLMIDDKINKKAVEFEKIGICRIHHRTYCYLKIDEYYLMDSNHKLYGFPPCKVAVQIENPIEVLVLDRYKHPFLSGFGSMQRICFGSAPKKSRIDRHSIISNLNNGVQILQMGWPSESPYHPLSYFRESFCGWMGSFDSQKKQKITNLINFKTV